MGMWTMEIPGWHPAPLNKLLGHHFKAAGLKKADRAIVGRACLVYAVPPATGKRLVRLHLVLQPAQRACDPDAYYKSLYDALVAAGALRDDSRHFVLNEPPTFSRGEAKASFATLQDLDR